MLSVFEQCRDEPAETEAAWAKLYQDHQGDLVGLAVRRGCDLEDAKDLVQDVFVRLFKNGMAPRLISQPVENQRVVMRRTLKWMTSNLHRHQQSSGRRAVCSALSLELMTENGEEIASSDTPISIQNRRWVAGLLERSLERLRETVDGRQWKLIEESLFGSSKGAGQGVRCGSVRVALYRTRLRLREFVLEEAGEEVSQGSGVEALFEAVGVRG